MKAKGNEVARVPIDLLRHPVEPVDFDDLMRADREAPFGQAAIELAAEVAQILHHVTQETWAIRPGRDEGILRGLAIRAIKLLDRLVAASTANNGDTMILFVRLLIETAANLAYLLDGSSDRFDAYVWDGMTTPQIRQAAILKNVERRSGIVLPIEQRQLDAISDELARAGVSLSTPKDSRPRWPNMELRMKAVFGQASLIYDFVFRTGSDSVHGSWKDLLARQVDGETYQPIIEWRPADPTPVFVAVILCSPLFSKYAEYLGRPEEAQRFRAIASDAEEANSLYGAVYERDRPPTP